MVSFSAEGKDYTKKRVDFTFDKSTPRMCTEIDIIYDSIEEEEESFLVILTTTQTHTVSLKPQLASVTILDYGKLITCIPSRMEGCYSIHMWLSQGEIKHFLPWSKMSSLC